MRAADRTLSEDMNLLRALAQEAGKLALSFKLGGQSAETWHKTGGSPVTEADMAVNRLCAERLTRFRPDYGWLSEETLDNPEARRRDRCWVVDPIDGKLGIIKQSDVLRYMDAGVCQVAVMDAQDLIFEQYQGKHCDKSARAHDSHRRSRRE